MQLKFVVIGASGVGKTSIVRRLVEGKFVVSNPSTVGIEYFHYDMNVPLPDRGSERWGGQQNSLCRLLLWDTAGQERFYAIAKAYFRGSLGIIVVFDITSRRSWEDVPRWIRDSRVEADPRAVVILVGNKLDRKADRMVPVEEAEKFARQHGIEYIETSAADPSPAGNVQLLFMRAATEIVRRIAVGEIQSVRFAERRQGVEIKQDQEAKQGKGCC